MKMALLAAAALIATPLVAQTTPATPAPTDQSTMTTPPASTDQTTTTTTTTPPASTDQTTMPMAAPTLTASPAPMAGDVAPAPAASTGKLPWCRAGQFTGCREHENAKGEGMRKN